MRVVSIQSHVADGAVGNAASVFPMQRLGVEVVPVHTVQLSNHPGDGAFGGDVFAAEHVARVLAGLEARGIASRADAVLSGYLGSKATAEAVDAAVERWQRQSPSLVYACDPVIGDTGKGVYVRADVAEFIRDRLIPRAQIACPNLFELEFLTGMQVRDARTLVRAMAALAARGPSVVVVTSVDYPDRPEETGIAVWTDGAVIEHRSGRITGTYSGAGDCFAAIFLTHWLKAGDAGLALQRAGQTIHDLISLTAQLGRRDLALVDGQALFTL
jgi:pyridoxine kinase